jgi:glycosyltransferase involved in cell wall biosynthesis
MITGMFPLMRSGVGDYSFQLVRAMADCGIQISIITSNNSNIVSEINDNIKIYPVISRWDLLGVCRLTRIVGDLKPHVVHIQYPSWFKQGLTTAVHLMPKLLQRQLHNIPVVFTLHEARHVRWRWLARPLVSAFLSDVIVCVTEDDQDLIKKIFPWKRVECINIGPNILPQAGSFQSREAIRAELGIGSDHLLLFYFGAARQSTGIDLTLEAYKALLYSSKNLKLLIVSNLEVNSPNDYIAVKDARRVKQLISDLDLNNHVILRGYAEPSMLSCYLAASDIGVFPYLSGVSSQRGAALACLAHGLPLVTTKGRYLPNDFVHLKNMFLVEPGNLNELMEGIKQVATSEALRALIGSGAIELSKKFEWPHIAKKTIAMYNSLRY